MIIIGARKEIEEMIDKTCPYNSPRFCDNDCRACWNRSASIVIACPEKVGSKDGFLHSMTNLDNFIEEEGDDE